MKKILEEEQDKKVDFVLGKGMYYPIAMEIALKIKEVAYIHCEALMTAELKHGSLALVDENTSVVCLGTCSKEAESRGAKVVVYDEHPLLCLLRGQLISYHLAHEKGLAIDKPRNLAKSVTV